MVVHISHAPQNLLHHRGGIQFAEAALLSGSQLRGVDDDGLNGLDAGDVEIPMENTMPLVFVLFFESMLAIIYIPVHAYTVKDYVLCMNTYVLQKYDMPPGHELEVGWKIVFQPRFLICVSGSMLLVVDGMGRP